MNRALACVVLHCVLPRRRYGRCNAFARAAVSQALLRSAVVTEPARLVRAGRGRAHAAPLSAPRGMSLFPHFTTGAYPDLSLAVLGRA